MSAARSSADLLSLARVRFLQGARAMGSDVLALLPDDEADQEGPGSQELFRRGDAAAGRVRRNRQVRRIVRRQDSAHPRCAGARGGRAPSGVISDTISEPARRCRRSGRGERLAPRESRKRAASLQPCPYCCADVCGSLSSCAAICYSCAVISRVGMPNLSTYQSPTSIFIAGTTDTLLVLLSGRPLRRVRKRSHSSSAIAVLTSVAMTHPHLQPTL